MSLSTAAVLDMLNSQLTSRQEQEIHQNYYMRELIRCRVAGMDAGNGLPGRTASSCR